MLTREAMRGIYENPGSVNPFLDYILPSTADYDEKRKELSGFLIGKYGNDSYRNASTFLELAYAMGFLKDFTYYGDFVWKY